MSFDFVMGSGGVPAGAYAAEFIGCEAFTDNSEKYGEGVLLKWRVVGGEQDGNEAGRICSKRFSPKCNLASFAIALKGEAIQSGESFSFAQYVGTRGTILVEATDSGGTRVATFIKQQTPPAQPAATVPTTSH